MVSLNWNSFTVNHHNYTSTSYTLLMSPSPKSPSFQRNDSKPYTRGVTPTIPPLPHVLQDSNIPINNELSGFPTYAQYKQVENAYIQSLTPRRQSKALISQSMFDRIWDVLQHPERPGETAQFRFWVRKMFTLSKTHRNTLGAVVNDDEVPEEVLLHDNLLVAVQEQLYDLLCYCHGMTGHGGRDKTCSLIRKHYTWVPKDLVSNFVKACPTCIMKKSGSLDSSAVAQSTGYECKIEDMSVPVLLKFHQNIYSQDQAIAASSSTMPGIVWPTMRDSGSGRILLEDDPLEAAYREAIFRARDVKAKARMSVTPRGLQGVPMSREVSLYKGLPNGWQYRHSDYASAHAEFMQMKDLLVQDSDPRNSRPRVPSIAPLWGPNDYPQIDNLNDVEPTEADILSLPHFGGQGCDPYLPLTYMLSDSSERPAREGEIIHQIDPNLVGVSAATTYDQSDSEDTSITTGVTAGVNFTSTSTHPSSSSLKRDAAPPRLNLDSLPTEKSFQDLMAYRESLGDGDVRSDSPMINWYPGNTSPASSFDSCVSHLSYIASPTSSLSAPTTALPTPVDEYGTDDLGNFVKGKGKLTLEETMEMELSCSVDVVYGL
jgi:Integrase zinc binding domain